jgi:Asp-tRNA(Asn)/Glu-tRNA(Gln) amidotransferase A subunit family amidase
MARPPANGFVAPTAHDYATAYAARETTPEEVAMRALDAIEASDRTSPPLRAFIAWQREDVMAQARTSTARLLAGEPRSTLEGVPVAVKDEFDQVPYGTTVGTRFLGKSPAKEDATAVARLRAAGALLIGKANMHEIGIGVTGLNPHHGTARNPYNPRRYTGGSSSGPAAAAAAGFCPMALGADGGGSIRIPSSLCGVVGLKPTYGRVSGYGAAQIDWSVAHAGPIGATALDAALLYAVIAGVDVRDPLSYFQPPVEANGIDNLNLHDLNIGVYRPWFEHAEPAVVAACDALLRQWQSLGASVREVILPELEAIRTAHALTILSEMLACMRPYFAEHGKEFGLDVRINLALARAFTAQDYLQAQRVRTRAIAHFNRALEEVDVIVTPATGRTAPPIAPDALPDGESDLTMTAQLMRFIVAGNFTGLPAISFPVGYDEQGLPIGMQAIGRLWQEATLLRLAYVAEHFIARKKPAIWFQML